MEKIKIDLCPFCKSENFVHDEKIYGEGSTPYHCLDCDCWFNEDDYLHQLYWENISCLLNGTSEENPFMMDYILPSIDEMSCGLSDAEKLNIDKVYQIEGEGTMWYHFEYTRDDDWYDMYELSTEDLRGLLDEIRRKKEK